MSAAFDRAFEIVVGHEGGYSDDPNDPGNFTGGAVGKGELRGTNWGISAAAYPIKDIKNLTIDQAKAIYATDYWLRVRGDDLPPALALLCFDAAVNSGVSRAVMWLQEAVGTTPDGAIGPATLAAVKAWDGKGAALCAEFVARRLVFLASLPTWRSFALGWSRRLCSLPYQAMSMESP